MSMREVMGDGFDTVFDDSCSTALIRVDTARRDEEKCTAAIIAWKRDWEKRFPEKRIVAMATITGSYLVIGLVKPCPAGLIIHYELRSDTK